MTNRTKDITLFCLVIFVIVFTIFALGFAVGKSYAETPEQAQINRYYTEESLKTEMRYLAMWQYTENMTDEEYNKTFMEE